MYLQARPDLGENSHDTEAGSELSQSSVMFEYSNVEEEGKKPKRRKAKKAKDGYVIA